MVDGDLPAPQQRTPARTRPRDTIARMQPPRRLIAWLSATLLVTLASSPAGRPAQAQGARTQRPPASRDSPRLQPGETCPPGTTEIRPGRCQAPENPPPSIVDYRPRTTLVTEEHAVPKAKFPAVDLHGHPNRLLDSPDLLNQLVTSMDSLNLRVMIAADNVSGDRLSRVLGTVKASPHRDRIRVLTGINFANVGPGWAERAIAQLEADVKAGAVGVGEISKALGLHVKKADGALLTIDDPALDPIWAACARLNLPVFIHTADPAEFFEPIDNRNERWLELSLFPDRRYQDPRYPRFEALMTQRDRLFTRHPKTQFIAAHLGWHGSDLARLGRMLDAMPNVTTELGAVIYEIGRQPRAAREFLIKYQDRVLFGKDAWAPSEYPTYWRVLETRDDYFDYYRGYHAFWKMYGIDLPDEVLQKIYYKNALRVVRGLPQTGWPK
jgi:predicted TIM-barrel fold metal-dependent hydrolase